MKRILTLNADGQLGFKAKAPTNPRAYLFSVNAVWYWVVVALNIAATASVIIIPDTAFPTVYVRYLFGAILVLILPGFCLIKALFPQKEFDQIERAALAVGMSLVIVPLVAFLLNYTFWGITIITLIVSLVPFTVACATIAIVREYSARILH